MKENDLKNIIALLDFSNGKYDIKKIFSDIVALEAYFINIFLIGKEEYSKAFDRIIQTYTISEQGEIYKVLLELAELFNKHYKEYEDILGNVFNQLNLGNVKTGQFFTPTNISDLMSKVIGIDKDKLDKEGYVTLHEPTCRSRWNDFILC